MNNEMIVLQDYIFYGHNRKTVHNKAKKGSGGVGICVLKILSVMPLIFQYLVKNMKI